MAIIPFCACVGGFTGDACELSSDDAMSAQENETTAEIDPLWALLLLLLLPLLGLAFRQGRPTNKGSGTMENYTGLASEAAATEFGSAINILEDGLAVPDMAAGSQQFHFLTDENGNALKGMDTSPGGTLKIPTDFVVESPTLANSTSGKVKVKSVKRANPLFGAFEKDEVAMSLAAAELGFGSDLGGNNVIAEEDEDESSSPLVACPTVRPNLDSDSSVPAMDGRDVEYASAILSGAVNPLFLKNGPNRKATNWGDEYMLTAGDNKDKSEYMDTVASTAIEEDDEYVLFWPVSHAVAKLRQAFCTIGMYCAGNVSY